MTATLWHWLAYAAVSSFVLFAAAGVAVLITDQPVKRLRFIQWALAGCLLAPFANQLPGMPQWHLGFFETSGSASAAPNSPAEPLAAARQPEPPPKPVPATSSPETRDVGMEFPAPQQITLREGPKQPAADPPVSPVRTDARRPPARAAVEPETAARIDFPAIVLTAYAGILGGLLLWWLVGLLKLIGLTRRSRPASPDVLDELHRIAAGEPLARRVQVLVSDRIDMPLTYGLRRPVILLPAAICEPQRRPRLRYCLAHEWAHVKSRDILPWYLATLTQFLYFYQPLFWWLRRQMRLCQDYLADDFAARRVEAPEDYAEFLVEQTRNRIQRFCPAALGFADRKSNLFRRVRMLLQNRALDRSCRRRWSIAVALLAACVLAGLAAIRLDAARTAEEKKEAKADSKSDKPQATEKKDAGKKPKAITYHGVVIDRISKKPIPGTTVIVERTLSHPPKGMEDWKKISRVKSDANGKYAFTLGPDETAERSLYIVVDAHHPQYAAKGHSGYAHSMIKKNLKMGEKPFYATIKLWPGKAVTGTVVTPDGKPVQGAEVLTYSKHSKAAKRLFSGGGFYTTKTDAKGRFRFVAATPGEGVFWVTPKGFAEQAFVIPENRGDVGRIVLQHGEVLKGKVLDAKGKPVPHVMVEARRNGDGEDVDRFLGQNAIANHIGRRGKTNAKGEFRLDELPSGNYTLNVHPVRRGWAMEPLKQVFVRQPLTIRDGETPAPLEIRAVPHVEIHITWRDSKGKPSGGWRTHVFGRLDKGTFFTQSSRVDRKTGHSVVRVPHGLQRTQMSIISNEHASLRWRLKPGDPLQARYHANLGTLEADVEGFEIIRYVAPILLVKAVDESGKPLPSFKPKAVYEKGKSPKDPNSRFINGVRGDVSFEKQTDGRWRSSQLLPDEKLAVTAELDGYTTTAQRVTLKEGKTRELVFVMKPKTAGKPKAAGKKTAAKSITYTGRLLDHITGKPIEGATVTIERTVSSNGRRKTKEFKRTTRVTTNTTGQYSFTLPPDEVARPGLYVTVRVEHPNYADPGPSGYPHAMIVKNQRLGESPFFSEIKLWPGKAVTGVVVAPDGSPVAGAKMTTFCKHDKARRFEFHGFGETRTDKNGHFRFVVPTPGEGAFWIYPKDYAVYSQLIGKRRGDLGNIVVQKGARLKGRVLDAKGKPLAGIYVGARQTGLEGELANFLGRNAIGNLTARSTHTNNNGEFELEDLPDGDYYLGVEPNRNEFTQPAKHVFLRRSVKLSAADKPAPLVVRAVPHIEIRAQWIDSKGKPTRGYQFYVLGRLDGKSWVARSTRPDEKSGRVVVAVPHGLQDARLNLIANEHSSLRWRLKPGDALRRGRYVLLGNVDDDLSGIEIVRYTAPILLLKPVDKNGKLVRDVTIQSRYDPDQPPPRFGIRFNTGEVRFKQQNDGRWRSTQMLPDIATKITVKKDGYEARPQTVSLKEGSTRELVFVMKPKASAKKPEKAGKR